MNINTRYLLNVAGPTRRQRIFGCLLLSFLIVAVSGCAELQKINAEKNQPVNSNVEKKLQPGPALPGRTVSTVAPTSANDMQSAGINSGAATKTLTVTAPSEMDAAAKPPRDASRTYVGTGNFVN